MYPHPFHFEPIYILYIICTWLNTKNGWMFSSPSSNLYPPALLAHDPKLPTEPTGIKVFQGNAIHHDLQSSKRAVPSPEKIIHRKTAAFVRISLFLVVYQC